MAEINEQSYDYICFNDLAYEFDFSNPKEAERKIKQKLKYYKLGKYSQEKVDYIRVLRNDLFKEIRQETKSKYFKSSKSSYAEFTDFDVKRMLSDYLNQYDRINDSDMSAILNLAIYLYHMR